MIEGKSAPAKWETEFDQSYFTPPGRFKFAVKRVKKTGHLCGYVQLPLGHPMHGKGYDEVHEALDIRVHGGLTYSKAIDPLTGAPDKDGGWWLGFDAAHSGDLIPAHQQLYKGTRLDTSEHETYRTTEYMIDECLRLADTLAQSVSTGKTKHLMATVTCISRGGLKKYEIGNLAISINESGEITICSGNYCQTYSAEESEDLRTLFEALKIQHP